MQLFYLLLCSLALNYGYSQSAVAFPLRVSDNQRYLEDAQGQPFFYQADTPWHLFFKLTLTEVSEYLDTRKQQGFNSLQIMLTGAKGQLNLYGESPWLGDHDFSQPNALFFNRVDSILNVIEAKGFFVGIVPLWAGCCRADMAGLDTQGQPLPMNVNGVEKTYQFSRWLGQRYATYNNIMWIIGGDNDPYGAPEAYAALVKGLQETTSEHLFTYHAASTHSSTDVYPEADWLDISMIYTYFRGFNKAWNRIQSDVYEVAYDEYQKSAMPFFLGESTYEEEHGAWGSARQVRKQAYWAALRGSTGHAYGSPNWHLPEDWRATLQLPGARSLRHLLDLMHQLHFHQLEPDWESELLITGSGQYASNDYAVAAFTANRQGAVIYLPSGRSLQIQLQLIQNDSYQLKWYNPRTGKSFNSKSYTRPTKTPILNTPDDEDWILLINVD